MKQVSRENAATSPPDEGQARKGDHNQHRPDTGHLRSEVTKCKKKRRKCRSREEEEGESRSEINVALASSKYWRAAPRDRLSLLKENVAIFSKMEVKLNESFR